MRKNLVKRAEKYQNVVDLCTRVREEHYTLGCRKIHRSFANNLKVGRDKFMRVCRENGLFLTVKRNPRITTIAIKNQEVPNLIEGQTIQKTNQVWQSDIFYYHYQGRDRYVFTIIDVYSRRLLAVQTANSLHAVHLVNALRQARKMRKGQDLSGCIFHSDRGRQYFAKEVLSLLEKMKMKRSMALRAQQNAYAERVQGTIQHEYLDYMGKSQPLEKIVQLAMDRYNNKRPHMELNFMSPSQYEKEINKQPMNKRPETHVYQWVEKEFTIIPLPNKKEKSNKKEKTTTTLVNL